ncbi:Transcriptional regulatory protein SIN3 [Choanephora cucurbitarum]|uniref:Transcriptional regulatory protein SIN3 n=1 Tax=Choanephora cucurbitarum TaxID=101091 RepID=A0A1C7N7P1_9FUNG|nr:Transcriptional regulatory protein SIN3 [Choanephora cucurbitarum]
MSSPIQPPPPNIRSPSVGSQQPSIPSPYAHHLPPPNLSNSQLNANGPLPPPPRVTELPPLLSSSQSPRSSSPSFSSHHTLPPASSLSSEHTLPPIPPRTSTPPFAERRSSIARAPIGPPPSTSVLSHPPQQQSLTSVPPSSQSTQVPIATTPVATGNPTSTVPPPPPPPAVASPSSQQSNVGYRPLNVRDALTYLDQVKVRFSDQPDVYNRFLDIMKDFKSQAIDTPGVIERVSTLFKGHPTLISGFNTFLPPGYRIECSTDPREPDLITVTTPNGVTTTTGGSGRMYGLDPENPNTMHGHPTVIHHPPPPPGATVVAPVGNAPPPQPYYSYSHMHQPPPPPPMPIQTASSGHPMHSIPPPQQQSMMSQPIYHQPPLPSAPPSNMPRPSQQQPQQPQPQPQQHAPVSIHHSPTQTNNEKRSPVEFNHAINYVNKIKNRFANEPEIYKQFLEILQTYQKDQKPIQEVYAHVQYLFSSAPDLLDEFKQFLPDITGQPASNLFDTISPTYYSGSKRSVIGTPPPHGMLPPGKKKRTNALS